jgi:hypothetical protein
MGSLHLQGDWSYREVGRAFDDNHKTGKRHLALLNLFFSSNPTPESSVI